jgi:hypothetical protein
MMARGIWHKQGKVGILVHYQDRYYYYYYWQGKQGIQVARLVILKYTNPLDLVGFDLMEYQEEENCNIDYY